MTQKPQYSVQTVVRLSPSRVEYGPVSHVSDPSQIVYPLTGDFQCGEYDAAVERLAVGQTRVFIPQAAMRDRHAHP